MSGSGDTGGIPPGGSDGGLAEVTLLVLAGGAGRRLGRGEKALVPVGGRPMIAYALNLAPAFAAACVVAARPTPGLSALGVPLVTDRIPGRGAPGGLDAGLAASGTAWACALACDMPRVDLRALARLAAARDGVDAVVAAAGGRRHPLHALYRVAAVGPVVERVAGEGGSLRDVLSAVRTREVDLGGLAHSVANVNTPEELEAAEAALGAS